MTDRQDTRGENTDYKKRKKEKKKKRKKEKKGESDRK